MDEIQVIVFLFLTNALFIYLFLDRLSKEHKSKDYEQKVRQDAIEKSRIVLEGKFKEQLAPLFPEFTYNPTDARFLGSPIDYVVFDGLANNEPKEIVFIEVKSGEAQLTEREKLVKSIIEKGKVRYQLLRVD